MEADIPPESTRSNIPVGWVVVALLVAVGVGTALMAVALSIGEGRVIWCDSARGLEAALLESVRTAERRLGDRCWAPSPATWTAATIAFIAPQALWVGATVKLIRRQSRS